MHNGIKLNTREIRNKKLKMYNSFLKMYFFFFSQKNACCRCENTSKIEGYRDKVREKQVKRSRQHGSSTEN